MADLPTTHNAPGDPESLKERVLGTGAGMLQSFTPVNQICAHLHAFHAYADNAPPSSLQSSNDKAADAPVSTHHFCAHLNEDVRQCLLYDSASAHARLVGIEYMITPRLYETLEPEERRLWHSHVFEVKSGMLHMPVPTGVPLTAWEVAEKAEMEEVIVLYGKVWQLWQPGDALPLGKPRLMTSYTQREQLDFEKVVGERDAEQGVDSGRKAEQRKDIPEPEIHPDADWQWKKE